MAQLFPANLAWDAQSIVDGALRGISAPAGAAKPALPAAGVTMVLAGALAAHVLLPGHAAIAFGVVLTVLFAAGGLARRGHGEQYAWKIGQRLAVEMRLLAIWAGAATLVLCLASAARLCAPASTRLVLTGAGFAVAAAMAAWGLAWLGMAWFARTGRFVRSLAVVDLSEAGGCVGWVADLAPERSRLVGVWTGSKGLGELIARSGTTRIDEVLVTAKGVDRSLLNEAIRQLAPLPAGLHLWPGLPAPARPAQRMPGVCGIPAIEVIGAPPWGGRALVKRCCDVALSGLILVAVSPVLLVLAAVVRIDGPGPVLFRQRRLGFNNQEFVIYKFRTMRHVPCPAGPGQANPSQAGEVLQATRGDLRVSRVGAFLRRKSLDELPQLINVLRGDMSLVGPRPHAVPHHRMYAGLIEGYPGRHRMRPGITGWAQVNGFRGETETLDKMRGRVCLDLAYIDNWSFWLDVRIVLRTALLIAWDRNAY